MFVIFLVNFIFVPKVMGVSCLLFVFQGTMFLTTVLLRKRIPGKQWIGKYRQPRVVTLSMKQAMIRRLETEAENEYWLSRPYLTQEQEYNHNKEGRRAKWEALKSSLTSKFPEHRYMSDHLNHLNVSKKWTSWITGCTCMWQLLCTATKYAVVPVTVTL